VRRAAVAGVLAALACGSGACLSMRAGSDGGEPGDGSFKGGPFDASPKPDAADAPAADRMPAPPDAGSGEPLPASCAAADRTGLALPAADICAGGTDGGSTGEFGPARPLGVGFPDRGDLLPPHVAYLTFDDGPSDWTGEFLDILAAKGVHATFFINAKNLKGAAGLGATYIDAAGNPAVFRDVVKRAVDEGHVLGNHTVDHLDLAALPDAQAQAELDENERLVASALIRAGGVARLLTLVRPPFGSPWYHHAPLPPDQGVAEIAVAGIISARGVNVMWTVDSSDSVEWAQGESFTRVPGQITPAATAPSYTDKIARVEQTVLNDPAVTAGAGAVILMHDTHNATRDALSVIIDGLRAAGYSFGTIEEYVQWRWGRPSADLTPGPGLYSTCVDEGDWGCASFGAPVGSDRSHEVCGRMWRGYQLLGGAAALGAPVAAPTTDAATGLMSQSFQRGVVTLHPENSQPCDVIAIPP
jgi:peptidoglycan/xylan/chitin deacetylase (PgdA/CDA1 family)